MLGCLACLRVPAVLTSSHCLCSATADACLCSTRLLLSLSSPSLRVSSCLCIFKNLDANHLSLPVLSSACPWAGRCVCSGVKTWTAVAGWVCLNEYSKINISKELVLFIRHTALWWDNSGVLHGLELLCFLVQCPLPLHMGAVRLILDRQHVLNSKLVGLTVLLQWNTCLSSITGGKLCMWRYKYKVLLFLWFFPRWPYLQAVWNRFQFWIVPGTKWNSTFLFPYLSVDLCSEEKSCSVPRNHQFQNMKSPCTSF